MWHVEMKCWFYYLLLFRYDAHSCADRSPDVCVCGGLQSGNLASQSHSHMMHGQSNHLNVVTRTHDLKLNLRLWSARFLLSKNMCTRLAIN